MLINYLGHAKFLIELDSGYRIVTDPYDSSVGYRMEKLRVDAVLVSHQHHDHNAVETVTGVTSVIDSAGVWTLEPGVSVRAIEAFHDEAQGSKRGKTLLFVLEAEGLKIAHLGDLGHLPTDEQVSQLKNVDVLMIPVGGFFTIDAATAKQTCELINPRTIIPMHYKTVVNQSWPIAPVDDFLAYYPQRDVMDLLRIEKEDVACQPSVAVLRPQML